jgi:hypothetical protein
MKVSNDWRWPSLQQDGVLMGTKRKKMISVGGSAKVVVPGEAMSDEELPPICPSRAMVKDTDQDLQSRIWARLQSTLEAGQVREEAPVHARAPEAVAYLFTTEGGLHTVPPSPLSVTDARKLRGNVWGTKNSRFCIVADTAIVAAEVQHVRNALVVTEEQRLLNKTPVCAFVKLSGVHLTKHDWWVRASANRTDYVVVQGLGTPRSVCINDASRGSLFKEYLEYVKSMARSVALHPAESDFVPVPNDERQSGSRKGSPRPA